MQQCQFPVICASAAVLAGGLCEPADLALEYFVDLETGCLAVAAMSESSGQKGPGADFDFDLAVCLRWLAELQPWQTLAAADTVPDFQYCLEHFAIAALLDHYFAASNHCARELDHVPSHQ